MLIPSVAPDTLDPSRQQVILDRAIPPGIFEIRDRPTVSVEVLKPFLKWAGGKTRLLPQLLPYVPKAFRDYHEPFLGGGAVFFAARSRTTGRSFLADLNEELVNTWIMVRDQPDQLVRALGAYVGKDSEDEYYAVRGATPLETLERAARFIYLNQTAWNGLWRVNRWGAFNVPWGDRPFRGVDAGELQRVSVGVRAASIEVADFRTSLERVHAGDFVYLDPPYLPVSDTSKFSGYTEKRFRLADLQELAEACKSLTKRGAHWVLSNRDNRTIRELFADARVVSLTTRRAVAAQNRRDVQPADSPEVIVVGGPTT